MEITTKTVHEVQYGEMESAVAEHFGAPYSVMVAEEADNGSVVSAHADGADLNNYDADKIKQWQESGLEGHSPRARVVLSAMAKAGVIPVGEYLIDITY